MLKFEAKEVLIKQKEFASFRQEITDKLSFTNTCTLLKTRRITRDLQQNEKVIHFIRHGQGFHNVAQKEWKERADYDGNSEPYSSDRDLEFKFLDPSLTKQGESEAALLQPILENLSPEVVITSTRAIQTGLIAFQNKQLPFVASELCHEIGGLHTCDKRKDLNDLKSEYPNVDFSTVKDEVDPLWLDGKTRETRIQVATRASKFLEFLKNREEKEIAVTSHSTLLLSLFNSVLWFEECSDEEKEQAYLWFGTGELRSVLIKFEDK
eukprot:maker-scaffold_15-snap-gene-7.41-mRNA-1 protein AED:0.01 eAED:0.01 QI:69/0.75/0.8/1/0.75/0.6/5/110/265